MNTREDFIQNIENLLRTYTRGIPFFDKLDESIQNESFYQNILMPFILEHFPDLIENYTIVVSGGFGRWRVNSNDLLNKNSCIKLLLVNGGLRNRRAEVDNLDYLHDEIINHHFILLDDSFYSGNTRNSIQHEIERQGGFFDGTIIAYDGAKRKEEKVWGVYRYYDHHNLQGQKIKIVG